MSDDDYRFLLGVLLGIRLALVVLGREGDWTRRVGS